jgi:hypothetical protein
MNLSQHLAKHLRDVHFGGNWTSVNLKDSLKDVGLQQANRKVQSFYSIATLVYHMNYYVDVTSKVLEGGPLNAKDAYSFNLPPIQSEEDWQNLLSKVWADAEKFALLIEQLPESKLWEDFTDEKYGSYYRNIQGIIEHCHYHLGQIVIIKKIVVAS